MNEIRILSAGAVKRGVARLAEAYSREAGRAVSVAFATAPELRRRMAAGEDADVVVAPPAVMDDLVQVGRIRQESRRFVGRSRMGVVVHVDSTVRAVPDVESFKRALLEATHVVYNTASSGIYTAKLLEKLGLAEQLETRIVVVETGAAIMEYVARQGTGAVGLAQISEIRVLVEKGLPLRLAAPLPDAVQNVTSYEAAAVANRADQGAAMAIASYLATGEAKAVFAATGID